MNCMAFRIANRLRPSQATARKWLVAAMEAHGPEPTAALLGCDRASMWEWRKGHGRITTSAARWLWVLQAEPWRTKTLFDLITWGRFAKPPRGWKAKQALKESQTSTNTSTMAVYDESFFSQPVEEKKY